VLRITPSSNTMVNAFRNTDIMITSPFSKKRMSTDKKDPVAEDYARDKRPVYATAGARDKARSARGSYHNRNDVRGDRIGRASQNPSRGGEVFARQLMVISKFRRSNLRENMPATNTCRE